MAGNYGYAPVRGSAEPMMQSYNPGRTAAQSQPPQRPQTNPKKSKGTKNYPSTTYSYQQTGELVAGVGITFAPNFEGHHVVTAIRPNSAAQMSRRILLGDIIHKVNKKPVQGLPTDHVVALLLGTPGTGVELAVLDGTFQYLPPKLVLLQRTPLNYPGYMPERQMAGFSGPGRSAIKGTRR